MDAKQIPAIEVIKEQAAIISKNISTLIGPVLIV